MHAQQLTEVPSRLSRKKLRTKDRLLKTMQAFVLEHGYEKTLISELTEEADVAMGTFYNYFESKMDIMDEVIDLVCQAYHLEIDELTEAVDDPAVRLAFSVKYTVEKLNSGDGLGKLLFDSGIPSDRYGISIFERGLSDVIEGIEDGRFEAVHPEITASMIYGGFFTVSQRLYFGLLSANAINAAVENSLRMVGVPAAEAQTIARRRYKNPHTYRLPVSLSEIIARTRENSTRHCYVASFNQY